MLRSIIFGGSALALAGAAILVFSYTPTAAMVAGCMMVAGLIVAAMASAVAICGGV